MASGLPESGDRGQVSPSRRPIGPIQRASARTGRFSVPCGLEGGSEERGHQDKCPPRDPTCDGTDGSTGPGLAVRRPSERATGHVGFGDRQRKTLQRLRAAP